jgi:hypothetical protein
MGMLFDFAGFFLIYTAVTYKRKEEIKLFTKDWLVLIALISIGHFLTTLTL